MNLLFLLLWFAVCADQDARQRRVSNLLTFGGAAVALVWLAITGTSWLGAPATQAGWALCLTLLLTLPGYALNRLGAGDVKLLVTLALASHPTYVLGTFIGAGLVSVVWLLARQKIVAYAGQGVTGRYPALFAQTSNKPPFVPFLLAGFVGTVVCLR